MLTAMKKLYDDFIRKIYDYTDDVKRRMKDILPVAKQWSYSECEVDKFLANFKVKIYQTGGVGDANYSIWITPYGTKYVARMNQ